MTISQYIVDLLKNYEDLEIETNHMSDGSDRNGLFKSPTRNIKGYTDSSYEITEFYQFMARQPAVSEGERKEADEWLEELTYWIDDFPLNYDFPEIDGGRTVAGLSITGIPAPLEEGEHDIVYQMSLTITYWRERGVA
ncbi:MAG: hypothetical protein IJP31_04590 [Lachnospiraceae bacterium]|nr:hypothetical protein [Lachnospiraceae bacterium]